MSEWVMVAATPSVADFGAAAGDWVRVLVSALPFCCQSEPRGYGQPVSNRQACRLCRSAFSLASSRPVESGLDGGPMALGLKSEFDACRPGERYSGSSITGGSDR